MNDDAEHLRRLAQLLKHSGMTPRERNAWAKLLFDIATRIQ